MTPSSAPQRRVATRSAGATGGDAASPAPSPESDVARPSKGERTSNGERTRRGRLWPWCGGAVALALGAALRRAPTPPAARATSHAAAAASFGSGPPAPEESAPSFPARWVTDAALVKSTIAKETDLPMYHKAARMVRAFRDHGIHILLASGSLLGARRHFGVVPWGDKDVDFLVLSTNTTAIEYVLSDVLKAEWDHQRDGDGPGRGGFGYNVKGGKEVPGMYVDLWLYGPTGADGDKYHCVGIEDGCRRWYKKYWGFGHRTPPVFAANDVVPPATIPFGPFLFPAPQNPDAVLDVMYFKLWRRRCKGWGRGGEPCTGLMKQYPFVYVDQDERKITVKRGKDELASFEMNFTLQSIS